MLNKELERLLLNYHCMNCIPLIEVCETDKNIKMIEVDKGKGFTSIEFINEHIEDYLRKLNITIKYVDMKDRLKELDDTPAVETKNVVKKCLNTVHAPFKRPMTKQKKVEMYKNYKMDLFAIDTDTFVICPDCKNFEKL